MLLDNELTRSKTLEFSLKAAKLKRQGRDIISLGLGEPEFDTPQHIKQAAKNALDAGLTRYGPAPGLPELRELIAERLRNENGIAATPDQIVVTPGAKNALFIACASLLRPGDEVINLTPCFVSNNPIVKLAEPQAVVHNIPMIPEKFMIDKERLSSLINSKTRLILINYPNNPSGKMLSADEADFLRKLVREKDIYLLSDEIYDRLAYGGIPHISLGSFDDIKEKVITVNGFSKAHAMTGWRVGYVHGNSDLISVITKIHQQINTNTAAFVQKGAVAAITGSQNHVQEFVENLKERKALYDALLRDNDHLTGSNPQGGFFGFLNISSSGLSSDAFATMLLRETGVAIIPGISFGADFDNYCRVSFVNHTALVAEGLKHIGDFVSKKVNTK